MKEKVDEMVRPWIEPEQLHVDHVREPRHWMPVSALSVQMAKRLANSVPGQAMLDEGVLGDVIGIVVVHESGLADRPERGASQQDQKNCCYECSLHRIRSHPESHAGATPRTRPSRRNWRGSASVLRD